MWRMRTHKEKCLGFALHLFTSSRSQWVMPNFGNRGKRPGGLGCWATLSDELREVGDGWVAGDDEPGAEVVPERDAELGAGLGEAEEGIAAVAAGIAARAAADLAFGHLAADVVFRAIG